jgi:GxxExxY protein
MTGTTGLLHGEITDVILSAFYAVGNALGYGFLEAVYHNAMFVELTERGIDVQKRVKFRVLYKGQTVGNYEADLLVAGVVIVEIKAGKAMDPTASPQLLNYLRASGREVGLVLNFGTSLEFKRHVWQGEQVAERAQRAR